MTVEKLREWWFKEEGMTIQYIHFDPEVCWQVWLNNP